MKKKGYSHPMVKSILFTLCVLCSGLAHAQYYYKDILSTQQTSAQLKKYREQGIRAISIVSSDDNTEESSVTGSQTISNNYTEINSTFKTELAGESGLATSFDAAGKLIKSVDTTDGSGSVSNYTYDGNGRLTSIVNVSTSPGMHIEKEEHRWTYNPEGKPQSMLRIKNDADTTYISFVYDEEGNLAEENSRRKGTAQTSYYYYYDDSNRLTDIVTYNQRAKRLLPIYVFEYNANDVLASMLVVPEGSDDYQRWQYEYNQAGLKTRETCFNKRRQMLGKVEYTYRK